MKNLKSIFPQLGQAGASARVSVRHILSRSFSVSTAKSKLMPPSMGLDEGAMVTVAVPGGLGFCATPNITKQGLLQAARRALRLAQLTQQKGVYDGLDLDTLMPVPRAAAIWRSPVQKVSHDRRDWLDLAAHEAGSVQQDSRLIYWTASLHEQSTEQNIYIDGELVSDQKFLFIDPLTSATAMVDGVCQLRHLGGRSTAGCQQGGDEQIDRVGFVGSCQRAAEEAIALASAAPCPSGEMDIVLMPDQMMLQIHESIGHPLELDRILGDERNYAGTSFVTLDMFGHYQYGSPLLTVRFDPGQRAASRPELASYATDDMAHVAAEQILIDKGILKSPLGSPLSIARAAQRGFDLDPVANSRASSWRRPPMDRMANINVDPGSALFDDMISSIDDGVLMSTNASWSIDDSRNKFQFGCEWGQRIRHGKLQELVRGPGYRGVSAHFWRSLDMVGGPETFRVLGTPNCGKGEPNQAVRVGHASPACLFRGVEVFGPAA
jgi:predicted Zn-dependent protease